MTITSLLVILYLVLGEIRDYNAVHINAELVVDKTHGQKLPIHMNITFPRVPCELLTLDVMDISGDLQPGVEHGMHKTRLDEKGLPIETKLHNLNDKEDEAGHLAPDYCGDCYGAPAPSTSAKKGCCQTCHDVQEAYASVGWAFGDGSTMAQCKREHFKEKLEAMRHEGCNMHGVVLVNKVVGNFHFAPGKSYSNMQMHVHDLELYNDPAAKYDFSHQIHNISFGPDLPPKVKLHKSGYGMVQNPLQNTNHISYDKRHNFMYFLKVVSTAYYPLDVDYQPHGELAYADILKGAIETHQYAVTTHDRSVEGGADPDDKHTVHARGGIPGVFFSYDISPMKVVNREVRMKSFAELLTGIAAVIGGTLTVAAAIDRMVHEGMIRAGKEHRT